ncbi:MAG: hypothetical protein P8X87_02630 [Candidatus Bathyarchaeota archaeon]
MRNRLIRKFEQAGATSMDSAVTFEEANLDVQEQYWLDYFAGSFLGCIKNEHFERLPIPNLLFLKNSIHLAHFV